MRGLLAIALVACSSSDATIESHATSCGAGTHDEGGTCVPDDVTRYTIRATSTIVADGDQPTSIVVFGRRPDGVPATDKIVLNTDRPNAGTFDPPVIELDERHSVAAFTPCSATVPGCTGPLAITAALASAPATPVTSFPVELVATPAIGSLEPCLIGGNVLYLEGKTFIHRGALTITDATFAGAGGTMRAEVIVVPTHEVQGPKWTVELTSVQLGTPLAPGIYRGTYQVPPVGAPGMKVFGDNPAAFCTTSYRGDFQIHDFVFTTSLQRLTATFRQWCGTAPSTNPHNIVTGCIHFE